jgi:hypothetical protein
LLYPLFDKQGNAVIPFGVIVLGLALYTLFHPGLRKDALNGNGEHSEMAPRDGSDHDPARTTATATPVVGPGEAGDKGGNGIGPGGGKVPRATTPVTHAASRVKYRR